MRANLYEYFTMRPPSPIPYYNRSRPAGRTAHSRLMSENRRDHLLARKAPRRGWCISHGVHHLQVPRATDGGNKGEAAHH